MFYLKQIKIEIDGLASHLTAGEGRREGAEIRTTLGAVFQNEVKRTAQMPFLAEAFRIDHPQFCTIIISEQF